MKQALFEARHQSLWDALEQWLDPASKQRRPAQADRFAPQYRQLCQHLALARRRGYSPQLVNRLQTLVEQGHSELYRAAPVRWGQLPAQLLAGFPRTVRRHWRSMLVAALLFWGPLLAALVLLQFRPELAERVIDAASLAKIERMYDPSAERLGRDAGSDWMMFGHYILNNISIGLRTFAGGLVLGIGAMAIVLFNGVYIGTVAGHLTANGYGGPFWQFVSGHSALELTAIVIAGGAGLQLGMRVLVPGRLSRRQALVAGGRDGAMLMLGVVVMLLGAAFVEAFWSARVSVPPMVKYSVGVLWWLLVLAWLVLGGRGGAMRPEDLQVALRPRTGMEAIALGMTLTRTHAGALWSVWLGFVLPLSLLLNLVLVPLDKAWLAGLLLWWLKPMGERAVLELLAHATFGQQLSRGKALRIAWLPDALLWPYLLWRRFGLARSLLMPADRLEGAPPARRRQRRSQLLRDDGPTGFLCTWLFSWLEIILMLGLVSLAGLMVPAEMLGDTLRDAWETLRNSEGSSRGLGVNLLLTAAIAITGPFYVACGFALYINRRTRSEGWDLELGLRRLARRLAQTLPGLAAAGMALLLGAALLPATARASQVTTTTAGPAPGAAAANRLGDGRDQADTAPERGTRQERPVPGLPGSNAGGSTWQQAAQRRQQDSRTPTPAPPTPAQRLSTAAEQAYRQPELGAVRQRQVHDPAEQEVDDKNRERLEKLEAWLKGSWLAHLGQAVRVLLWVMAIALLGLLLWYARRWLGWRVERDDAPAQEQHPAVIAEPLPAHPAAQARALWQAGQQRAALSLLYRASVAALERQLPHPLPDGATEAQCLAAAAHLPQQPDRELFATLVRTWQRAAYAGQLPDNAGFAHLVDALTQRRGVAVSPSTRRNLLIAVIAGALLLLAAAVVVLQAGPKRTETYLGPPDATAAHNPYFVLEKALLAAGQDARSQRYLRSLPETLQPTDTVVLAEHERGLNAAQRRGLRQFVVNGGHLVLAVPGKAPTTLSPLLVDFGLQAAPACDRSTRQPCPLPVLAGDNPVLLEQPGHLRLRHGKGSLDLVDRLTPLTTGTRRRKAEHADVRSYHHDGLANPAHRELAARLLAPHWDAGGTFHLVHGQRQDRWWLLLLLQHWPFWLPLALLLAGLLWAASQRLGPLLPEPPPVRRSLREHLAASAAHLWRHGRGIALYDAARADLQRQLALRAPALAGLHGLALEQALARHLRWPPDPVTQALSRPQAHDTRALQRRISLLMQMRNLL